LDVNLILSDLNLLNVSQEDSGNDSVDVERRIERRIGRRIEDRLGDAEGFGLLQWKGRTRSRQSSSSYSPPAHSSFLTDLLRTLPFLLEK